MIFDHEDDRVGEYVVYVRAEAAWPPLFFGNILELVDLQGRRTHGMVAAELVIGADVAVGHLPDALRVKKLEMVVLVEGIHVQLPAEVGIYPLVTQVVVILETETRQEFADAAEYLIDVKAQFRVGHDENHAVLLFHLQGPEAQR